MAIRSGIGAKTAAAALPGLCVLGVTQCARSDGFHTLAVDRRANATPWVAADGRFVAVAWGASAAGQSDVFVSVSRDEGLTFSAPVRVNSVAGEARVGGEQPPRVVLSPIHDSADPAITALWAARREREELKSATSRDGGRTFDAPVTLQAPGVPGGRGWPALAVDSAAAAHAVWLDHRGHGDVKSALARRPSERCTPRWRGDDAEIRALLRPCERLETRTQADRRCLLLLQDGLRGWKERDALRRLASRLSRQPARHGVRDLARHGASFSDPVRVSQDGWAVDACPDDGPALVADAAGTAHIVWSTVIGGSQPQGAIYYATTRDGRTFSPRIRIPTLGGVHPRHPQLVIDTAGRLVVAWDEPIDGQRVAAAREVRLDANHHASFGDIVRIDRDGKAVYPVLAATGSGIAVAWTGGSEPSAVRVRMLRLP